MLVRFALTQRTLYNFIATSSSIGRLSDAARYERMAYQHCAQSESVAMKTNGNQLAFSIVPGDNGPALSTTIGLAKLESHLWEAANILRGPVDAADFKTYVFPLLFFKRISDVYDEEYAAALAESGGDEEYAQFPQNYRFQIPRGAHWSDVRVVTTNVGQALQTAMREIEKANPETLYGIFGDAAWSNKERLHMAANKIGTIQPSAARGVRPHCRSGTGWKP